MFLSSYVKKILNSNDYIRALYAVISGPQVSSVPFLTSYYTVKKRLAIFPSPAEIIMVSDIPAGGKNIFNLFYNVLIE